VPIVLKYGSLRASPGL